MVLEGERGRGLRMVSVLEIGDRCVWRYGDQMKVFLTRSNGLDLAYICHTTNTGVTSLGVGRDTKSGLVLSLVEGLVGGAE